MASLLYSRIGNIVGSVNVDGEIPEDYQARQQIRAEWFHPLQEGITYHQRVLCESLCDQLSVQ